MYLKNLFIENNGPIEKLQILEKDIFKENGDPKLLIFVGKNGSGKTILLSNIVDALHEYSGSLFRDILPYEGTDRKYYRVIGGASQKVGTSYSFSFLNFNSGENFYEYLEKTGDIEYQLLKEKTDNLLTVNGGYEQAGNIKSVTSVNDDKGLERDFLQNTHCFFPVSRYENPHWLNDWRKEKKVQLKINNKFNGILNKPLIIDSSSNENKSWIMDLFLDSRTDIEDYIDERGQLKYRTKSNLDDIKLLNQGRKNIEKLLSKILQQEIELNLNYRNTGNTRLKIVNKRTQQDLIPSLDNLSGGQAILLNLFASIIRLSDEGDIRKSFQLQNIQGIVLIDEIDLSLHIDLQKDILPELIALFPKIQFIITTHSPFFLLGLEKKKEEDSNFDYQIIKLPDGNLCNDIKGIEEVENAFNTFEENFEDFKVEFDKIQEELNKLQSNNKPLIITEGKTDRKHLKKALQRLKTGNEYQDLDIDFVEYETDMGDDVLKNYCIVESKKNHTSPIICIFDRDKIDVVQRIEENGSPKKRGNNVYSFAIPKPDNRTFNEVCIEHYYTDDEIKTLDTNNRRLFLGSDFSAKYNTFCDTTGNWTKLKDKAGKNTIIDDRIYEVGDEIGTNNIALSKSAFSQNIYDDVDGFNSFDITNFKLIFEKIQLILNPQTPENDQPTTEI